MCVVVVLPLVPVMWMDGYAWSGRPSSSDRSVIRSRSGTIRFGWRANRPATAAA
jgi:hypothetical protein